jgi:hypothetical protein
MAFGEIDAIPIASTAASFIEVVIIILFLGLNFGQSGCPREIENPL